MQITEFKGKKWVIGLDWEQLPGDASMKQEAKEAAEKKNSSYGILVDYDQQSAIGLAKKDSKIPSAALYLALANQEVRAENSNLDNYPDWILVDEVGDDKYWMSVIRDGIPSPGFDVILDITSVKDKVYDLLINDTYRFYSPCGEIKSIFEGMKFVEERDLNSLTENIKTKIKFSKLRGIPNSIVIAGIVLIVVAGAGMGLSSFIESRNLKIKALEYKRQQAQEEAQQKATYDVEMGLYEKQKAAAKAAAIQSVLFGLSGKPAPIIGQWYNTIANISTGTHGWTLDTADCVLNLELPGNQNNCNLHFKRTGLSTNRMLLQDYPNAVISGDDALLNIPLPLTQDLLNVYQPADIDKLPNSKNWGFDMLSQLQLLKIANIDHQVNASQDVMYAVPPKPLTPTEKASGKKLPPPTQVSLNVAKGDVLVSSRNFDLLRELADNVDFYSVGMKKIAFKFGNLGDVTWEVDLNYFVKTGTGAIVESNSSVLSNSSIPVPVGQNPNQAPQIPMPTTQGLPIPGTNQTN